MHVSQRRLQIIITEAQQKNPAARIKHESALNTKKQNTSRQERKNKLSYRVQVSGTWTRSKIRPAMSGNCIAHVARARKFFPVYIESLLPKIIPSVHPIMIIYSDVISGDELLSDAYDVKLVDNVVYEADCAMVQVGNGGDVDIGGNPSAEGGEEDLDEGVETVNNVVYSFRLQQTQFDKKSFLTYIKGYMKKVKAHLAETAPEEVETFEKGAQAYVKKVIGSFNDWDFYTGESMDPDAMIVLLNYREDGTTPYVAIWKHGVKEEKI
ncbi:hypothetical protein FOB63_004782 [Clavispora lusitaniae]|nr:hypothetical protein FOB63_004782 [Clavispora lusitaniae]